MFITVNGQSINSLFIATFYMVDEEDFNIVYTLSNGRRLIETFVTSEERDAKYRDTVTALLKSGMFISINDKPQNVMFITSVKSEKIVNTETGETEYKTVYQTPSGNSTEEVFSSEIEQAEKAEEVVNTTMNAMSTFRTETVTSLPETGEAGVIYLVPKEGSNKDVYNEYIWVVINGVGDFEFIGTTAIDLSNYYNKGEIDAKLAIINTQISNLNTLVGTANDLVSDINGE